MTIHVPRSISSRLPARFALGATVTVVAAIVVGAVALARENTAPSGEQARNAPGIIVSEDSIRAGEAALQDAFGSSVSISSTEDGIRGSEVALDSAIRDAFNLPGGPVVLAPSEPISPLPPYASDGPAYP